MPYMTFPGYIIESLSRTTALFAHHVRIVTWRTSTNMRNSLAVLVFRDHARQHGGASTRQHVHTLLLLGSNLLRYWSMNTSYFIVGISALLCFGRLALLLVALPCTQMYRRGSQRRWWPQGRL